MVLHDVRQQNIGGIVVVWRGLRQEVNHIHTHPMSNKVQTKAVSITN